jgi:hypothetical protein
VIFSFSTIIRCPITRLLYNIEPNPVNSSTEIYFKSLLICIAIDIELFGVDRILN